MTQPYDLNSDPLRRGVTRRSFLKYCGSIAAALSLGPSFIPRIARALTSQDRPPVAWLHFSECTGCSESFLRSTRPSVEDILFDTISLDYHETVMVASGIQATSNLEDVVANHAGEFFCVVEGAIPTAENGIYGIVGGKTMLEIAQEVLPKAKAVIAFGTCAAYGGLAAAYPNPTGAKGISDALGLRTVNISGCPANHINLVSTLVNYLLFDRLPELDAKGRPLFAYGNQVHKQCGKPFGCLEDMGCKGKQCFHNCPTVKFNDATGWDIQAGHHCIGCSEPNFWDRFSPFYSSEYAHKFYEDYAFVSQVEIARDDYENDD
jgi:[NiFe] hydrogenase small subunit